jgi:spore coat polysaccharide biosynthesis protein SpsF
MKQFQTEQEQFWAGEFGDQYIGRNCGTRVVANNLALFANVLSHTRGIKSVIEFGANIGLNLKALCQLLPESELAAVEINAQAVAELKRWNELKKIYHQSILDFVPESQYDLAFTKGVLIHLNPNVLPKIYELLYQTSRKYILIAEYFNPTPVEVSYRGHEGKLFKRDFAGEMLDQFKDLTLMTYGFCYRRDPQFPQDNLNWFLLQKPDVV